MKGDRFPREIREFVDEQTGRTVRQLTDNGAHNRHLYFYAPTCTADGRTLIYISERTDERAFFTMDLASGESIQVSEGSGIFCGGSWYVEATRSLYYWHKNRVQSLNIDTLEEKTLIEEPRQGTYLSASADGRYVAYGIGLDEPASANPHQIPLRYAIVTVDTETGKRTEAKRIPFHTSHILINPADNDQITFCWEGAWSRIPQRIWWTSRDGTRGGPLGPQPPNQCRGHEFFSPSGKLMGYHGAFVSADLTRKSGLFGLMNADGTHDRVYDCGGETGHCQLSFDEQRVVCDRGGDTDGDGVIALIHLDHEKRTGTFEPLHSHAASWVTQGAHPHPQWLPGDEWVVFTTDRNGPNSGAPDKKGKSNVYLVDVQ